MASLVIAAQEEKCRAAMVHASSLSSGTGWFFLSTRYCHTSARAGYGPGLERSVPETNEIGGYTPYKLCLCTSLLLLTL